MRDTIDEEVQEIVREFSSKPTRLWSRIREILPKHDLVSYTLLVAILSLVMNLVNQQNSLAQTMSAVRATVHDLEERVANGLKELHASVDNHDQRLKAQEKRVGDLGNATNSLAAQVTALRKTVKHLQSQQSLESKKLSTLSTQLANERKAREAAEAARQRPTSETNPDQSDGVDTATDAGDSWAPRIKL